MINPHLATPLKKVVRGDGRLMLWVYAWGLLRAVGDLGTAHAIIATMHGAEHFLLRESDERPGERSDNFVLKRTFLVIARKKPLAAYATTAPVAFYGVFGRLGGPFCRAI